MLFTSAAFLVFQLVVVALRWTLPSRWTSALLLGSSYLFYLSWGAVYGLLIGAMTLVGWGAGLAISRGVDRRRVVGIAVVLLLGTLGTFKYGAFLFDQLHALGWPGGRRPDLILPLAISFYTFEVISYVVDVARGEKAERSLPRFALYVSYYPHLVAGPIVRASELLPQLERPARFDPERFSSGLSLFLFGFVKKLVFADRLAGWSDEVFARPLAHGGLEAWVGVLAYAGQIYCDFSGYTDIARGASRMLGLELPENFERPYLSTSLTEFWRRWHMTLSRWLRDYLYIPLGGRRHGTLAQYRNLFVTMLLGGLWHGASWTFVFWGALHGAGLAIHKRWSELGGAARLRASPLWRPFAWALTFGFVLVGWVFFRAPTFSRASEVLQALVRFEAPRVPSEPMQIALALLAVLALFEGLSEARAWSWVDQRLPAFGRGLVWLGLVVGCFLLAEPRAAFIYFQF